MTRRRQAGLSAAEEARLSRRIELGDPRAKDELIAANLGLVRAIARRSSGAGAPFEDLVQEGSIGLVRAVERFDHRRGVKFSTFAVWWIRRSVADAIGAEETIRIPRQAVRALAAVRRAEAELRRQPPQVAIDDAIAQRTGLNVERVRTLRTAARVGVSLDTEVGEDGAPLVDFVADPDPVDPWERLAERETHRQVGRMLRVIPRRHREVLVRRYGVGGERAQTHGEIAAALGVGEARSRQLEREALHRLRELDGGRRAVA